MFTVNCWEDKNKEKEAWIGPQKNSGPCVEGEIRETLFESRSKILLQITRVKKSNQNMPGSYHITILQSTATTPLK